ncbi:hypothetical protein GCM10011335_29220 [Aureimonas glaciei]|uniref:Uncharacterized protein n=2 Tax=Aureimonas glaciei TaxID=1776957 RepID=A0A916XZM2_9HYPH|nr:hypothetical protein GCM10011335_29220 [Aureimonas glaciei]
MLAVSAEWRAYVPTIRPAIVDGEKISGRVVMRRRLSGAVEFRNPTPDEIEEYLIANQDGGM